jgi:hypothetical protein
MGTMAMALQQIGQIAAQMAMQLGDEQSAVMIHQIAMTAAGGGGTAGMQPMQSGGFEMPQSEATSGNLEAEKHPYDQPATAVCLLVAFLLFCSVFALWGFTLSAVPRKGLHGWLTAAVALIGFGPSFMLMNLIYHYGEKLGQMILYG